MGSDADPDVPPHRDLGIVELRAAPGDLRLGVRQDRRGLEGIRRDEAHALSAARVCVHPGRHAGALRERVTSKGGTTAAALDVMKQHGWHEILEKAIDAASQRGKTMGDELGQH